MNDGGPAFPFARQGQTTGPEFYYGMTLRDYLAANAPQEPARWFEPKLTKLPDVPQGAAFCEGCKTDTLCWHTEACKNMKEHQKITAIIRTQRDKESYVQWRYAYADAMIAERSKFK